MLTWQALDITTELETTLESFTTTYTQVFSPTWPFNSEPYVVFGQALLSNLLGGLGYFYGDTKVDESHAPEYEEKEPNFWEKVAEARKRIEPATKGPSELFTHVPSRANFPRGFLWDEGFHLLPVLDWDADLALEVLQSWLELMDEDGWIAREQVMGPEARSKVPPDFVTQSPHIANPPTLFIVISHFVDMLAGRKKYLGQGSKYLADPEMGRSLLSQIYPKLKRHYEWFRRTQFGDVEAHSLPRASLSEGYRWRGRTPGYNLGSGLDDYPRAEPPDITELHVDALSWVGLMAQVLTQTAEHIHQEEDLSTYHAHTKAITQNLEEIHWSDNAAAYCDTRVYDDGHHFTCPKGYVSLSPFYTGLLGPEHPRLNATLDLLRDPQLLWTPYGVRSLSPESTQYGKGDNYWRSPIWININYLLLTQLLSLATTPGPLKARCRELYRDLRLNVVQNVYHQWSTTGFAWEQYNPDTGAGQRTQHFTGWTALVVRLMALPGLEGEEKEGYRVMVGHVGKVVKEHAGSGRGMGAGAVVVGLGLVVFFWMSRRKVARLRRGLGRRLL